ncbi:aspartate aminotransferase, cytoplasmic-like, partial [Arapaima gigas]
VEGGKIVLGFGRAGGRVQSLARNQPTAEATGPVRGLFLP